MFYYHFEDQKYCSKRQSSKNIINLKFRQFISKFSCKIVHFLLRTYTLRPPPWQQKFFLTFSVFWYNVSEMGLFIHISSEIATLKAFEKMCYIVTNSYFITIYSRLIYPGLTRYPDQPGITLRF